ncbi:O-antigen ligase family protein, partial [Candidatus Pseudothioglobus singularis]|nr:O-antigen ligase family protein [Candidatus Pseudothioglobus singularis]
MFKHISLDKVYQYLLIILAFLTPLTVFGANLIIVFISIIWISSGGYKAKLDLIISSKILLASIIFFSLHVVGLAWTEDMKWGAHIVHKMWYFIGLFPILYTIAKTEYIRYYISAFLVAISITEVVSYLIWFELIQPFKYATVENPTPFMSHISYNPILAIAIYIVCHEILFSSKNSQIKKVLYSFLSLTMSINMFITGGRAGQVMFFAVISILIFQYFHTQKIKAIVLILICTSSIFFSAFQLSPIFKHRALDVIENINNYDNTQQTPVGERITFAINSFHLIKENPLFGVGTGDFPNEYSYISRLHSPEISPTTNPHNMYILILCQLGALGLLSFLSIFYYQIKFSLTSVNKFNHDFGTALPLLFLLIMFSDSYLLGH